MSSGSKNIEHPSFLAILMMQVAFIFFSSSAFKPIFWKEMISKKYKTFSQKKKKSVICKTQNSNLHHPRQVIMYILKMHSQEGKETMVKSLWSDYITISCFLIRPIAQVYGRQHNITNHYPHLYAFKYYINKNKTKKQAEEKLISRNSNGKLLVLNDTFNHGKKCLSNYQAMNA